MRKNLSLNRVQLYMKPRLGAFNLNLNCVWPVCSIIIANAKVDVKGGYICGSCEVIFLPSLGTVYLEFWRSMCKNLGYFRVYADFSW